MLIIMILTVCSIALGSYTEAPAVTDNPLAWQTVGLADEIELESAIKEIESSDLKDFTE